MSECRPSEGGGGKKKGTSNRRKLHSFRFDPAEHEKERDSLWWREGETIDVVISARGEVRAANEGRREGGGVDGGATVRRRIRRGHMEGSFLWRAALEWEA